ncbi:MAG: DUF1565 domain-containing protein [Deltaproteobacteria bacterium]|nr:DUF1565 domain-containing protein [Deltaproteobacteria bacterium]
MLNHRIQTWHKSKRNIGQVISLQALTFALCFFYSLHSVVWAATYHVAIDGNDVTGTGNSATPWATITHALDNAEDDSIIEVHPGTYTGRIRIRGTFPQGVTVRSKTPYKAKLRNNNTVITAYTHPDGVNGITIDSFDIAHSGSGSGALVVHVDGGGNDEVKNITFSNNVLHDSYNNDILKINNGCTNILVSGNMFYNQNGSDEHIDINSVSDVTVEDNIFFNDFEGSGRVNQNNTSSYIVIKDSNGTDDIFTGSRNIMVRRNIFLNWQGSTGSNFVLAGEDGKSFYEAFDVLVENNLMLGNSGNVMRSAFGVKGCRDITFRNNTISGDLPSLAYAMRLNREGSNPANDNIRFYNNIWSDQSGTMGAENSSETNDFSDTSPDDTLTFVLENNLYWNGGTAIPENSSELINYTDDSSRLIADPQIPAPVNIVLPRWLESSGLFGDGSSTIRAAFENLVNYAVPDSSSQLIGWANDTFAPADDILGNLRTSPKDIGAFEQGAKIPGRGPAIVPVNYLLL